jgi:hypothetical protein
MRYFCSIIIISIGFACLAQTIPIDSMYLGQIPPTEIPKKFNLSVSPTFAAVERIAISNDGKCILYHENNGYNPSSLARDKYYKYENKKWNGPYILIDNAEAPALSITGDTVFFGHQGFVWYSVRNNSNWTQTLKFSNIPYWHYLQITNSGTYYAAMKNAKGKIGKTDWSKIIINKTDTLITSLGAPLNTTNDNLDFYISKDESFIIFASDRADIVKYGYFDLFVSFRKNDNSWTTPQNLGKVINDPAEVRWGPFVSSDKKYLFYSRTSKPDNSDACTYWIRIDNILDSLRKTTD